MNRIPKKLRLRGVFLLFLLLPGLAPTLRAQDSLPPDLKYVYFPLAPQRPWTVAAGITATTMPYEITEELHYRIPALEVHALRRLGGGFALDARASIQVLQNYISLGPRYSGRLTDRISFSLGNDVAFWFGRVNREGFKTSATGIQNFPNAALGYRFNRSVLLTLRAESIMTLSINPRAGDIKIRDNFERFSGSAYT
ncbi:MAG: hypothetical protein EOO11_10495, partial [Chitinophagaceae bacterium]